MDSCENARPTLVEDSAGASVVLHSGSEIPEQTVPLQSFSSVVGCSDNSDTLGGCKSEHTPGRVSSADATDKSFSRDGLVDGYEITGSSVPEKDVNNEVTTSLSGQCCEGDFHNPESGRLCLDKGSSQGEVDGKLGSETLSTVGLSENCFELSQHGDDRSDIVPVEGFLSNVEIPRVDVDAICLPNAFVYNESSPLGNCQMTLKESVVDLPGVCPQQKKEENTDRVPDSSDCAEESCESFSFKELEASKCSSPSQDLQAPSNLFYSVTESVTDLLHNQKHGQGSKSPPRDRTSDVFDVESDVSACFSGLHLQSGQEISENSLKATTVQNGQEGLRDDTRVFVACLDSKTKVVEQNILDADAPYVEITGSLKDNCLKTVTDCSSEKPFSPDSHQPPYFISSSSKDVFHLAKIDVDSINSAVLSAYNDQTDGKGKNDALVDAIAGSKCLDIVTSTRGSRRNKSTHKTQAKRASRKCMSKAPSDSMEIVFEAARKRRSSVSKPARSSVWGSLGNIEEFFEKSSVPEVHEIARPSKKQAGRKGRNKEKHSSISLQGPQKSFSNLRVRLKVSVGKETNQTHVKITVPEVADTSDVANHSATGLGSQNGTVDDNKGELEEGFGSTEKKPMQDLPSANGKLESNHSDSMGAVQNSSGGAEDLIISSENVIDGLVDVIDSKGMDPGTSPDSEVINAIPEVQVGEREDGNMHIATLTLKDLISPTDSKSVKRGKNKNMPPSNCIIEDGSPAPKGENKARSRKKNIGRKKNSNADINLGSSISKELSTNPMHYVRKLEPGSTMEDLAVENDVSAERACCLDVGDGLSVADSLENSVPSTACSEEKLPKDRKSRKVCKGRPKASNSGKGRKSRNQAAGKRREKQGKAVIKNKLLDNDVLRPVLSKADCHLDSDDVGKINAGNKNLTLCKHDTDTVSGSGLEDQEPIPNMAWVRCDDCHKWRRISTKLADLIEETNRSWTCKDSSNKAFADCSIPQEKSNADINAELGLSDASGEDDMYENCKNYKQLEYKRPIVSQESTFTHILSNEFLHRRRKSQTIDEVMVCHCTPNPSGKLGCGDECLNRMLNIECVEGTCPCGDLCSNQQFQKCNYAKLEWFRCGKKGYGLQAVEHIAPGQFLIEYVGEVLDMPAYDARQREYALKGHRHFYFMTLDGSEVIDASAKGNLGRFINHSCDPNCRTEKWMVNGEICIGLFALRDIKKGEELTFDYNYVRVFGAAAKKCYCGASQCRGYIGGDPLDAEVIVQGDSDEEFPEPVMLNEDGETEDSALGIRFSNDIMMQASGPESKDRNELNELAIDSRQLASYRKEISSVGACAASGLQGSQKLEHSNRNSPSSLRIEEPSQMGDRKNIDILPVQTFIEDGNIKKSSSNMEGFDITFSITPLAKEVLGNVTKALKSEIVESKEVSLKSGRLMKSRKIGHVKKERICSTPKCEKVQVTANKPQLLSIKEKRAIEGPNSRFEAVEEKLNDLLDGEGGISKRKDATKGYLKLLLLTAVSGDSLNGEAIQSNRDLSMILDALLKTKSRTVLTDIINKNGLRMLHNIMKKYRRDFYKTPILRKLLKILEYMAARNILTSEHINGLAPCAEMESFGDSILSLTEHDDRQVHQIARGFRDKWIRPFRNRETSGSESQRSCTSNRSMPVNNYWRDQDVRLTEPYASQSMLPTPSMDTSAQVSCSAPSTDDSESNKRRRKRKSRWDQPTETDSNPLSHPYKEQKVDYLQLHQVDFSLNRGGSNASLTCQENGNRDVGNFSGGVPNRSQQDALIKFDNGKTNFADDVPPGFSSPVHPYLGSFHVSSNDQEHRRHNDWHSANPSDAVLGHLQEKFLSRMPVSYGIPLSIVQQYGTPLAKITDGCAIAPSMPFSPFPPLPPYAREKRRHSASLATQPAIMNHPAEVSNRVACEPARGYSEPTPSTTGTNNQNADGWYGNMDSCKRIKGSSNDLGRRYYRQQKWNNGKQVVPWIRNGTAWGCNRNHSRGGMCSVGVGDVHNDPKTPNCSKLGRAGNNAYPHSQQQNQY